MSEETVDFVYTDQLKALADRVADLEQLLAQQAEINGKVLGMLAQSRKEAKPAIIIPSSLRELN